MGVATSVPRSPNARVELLQAICHGLDEAVLVGHCHISGVGGEPKTTIRAARDGWGGVVLTVYVAAGEAADYRAAIPETGRRPVVPDEARGG